MCQLSRAVTLIGFVTAVDAFVSSATHRRHDCMCTSSSSRGRSQSPSILHDSRDADSPTPPPHNELHLITFDLDDTIFPIGPVVADANEAQLATLHRLGYTGACNNEIIAASKRIRNELREVGKILTYTDLRKQSIHREIQRLIGTDTTIDYSVVETVFDAWLSERHASANRNLYQHASSSLECIRKHHPNAVIGAITNGRGNPLEMPSVADYFDFCVSGEDEGVFPKRKPDKGIYEAALNRFDEIRVRDDSLNWIHVGDDLANDVGASAECGAKAIWLTKEEDGAGELPSWSTATREELERRSKLDEVARAFVSAQITALDELPNAIMNILRV